MMDYQAARRAMVDSQLRPQAVTDAAVIAAMASVPRERFVPVAALGFAYFDRALPLGNGRAMTPPATLGRLLVELEVRPGERGLVVGAGTGYSAVILAELGAQVVALESDPMLVAILEQAVVAEVEIVDGDMTRGAPTHGPFDFILIDGAVEFVPNELIEQLKPAGRLGAALIEGGVQRLVIGRHAGGGLGFKSIADAAAPVLPGFARPYAFTF